MQFTLYLASFPRYGGLLVHFCARKRVPLFDVLVGSEPLHSGWGSWPRETRNIIIIILGPTSTKPQAEILKLNNVNGCNDISFGDHSILEGDRIPPLKSHGQALEEELCFPGVLSDNRMMRRPISCVTSMAVSCHAPAVSMAKLPLVSDETRIEHYYALSIQ